MESCICLWKVLNFRSNAFQRFLQNYYLYIGKFIDRCRKISGQRLVILVKYILR